MNKKILVLCTGNSCRSQMAEGYLRHFSSGKVDVYSAGIETHGVNSMAVSIMADDGIDISSHTSNHVNEYRGIDFDYIITVCDHAKENCPYVPYTAQRFHHNFTDPSKAVGSQEQMRNAFMEAREQIKRYCKDFVKENVLPL